MPPNGLGRVTLNLILILALAVARLERNAINIVQFSDKSTEDFPVISYTDGNKIDGRVGFAFVVFRSGVESEKI
ncbi:hypothetical protein TNCV_1711561 [Trichonephila clavipes]|nr:hypothetical protein TNCV_1711561 [Trichonephila clavipes]